MEVSKMKLKIELIEGLQQAQLLLAWDACPDRDRRDQIIHTIMERCIQSVEQA